MRQSWNRLAGEGQGREKVLEEAELVEIEEKEMKASVNDQQSANEGELLVQADRARPEQGHQEKEEKVQRIQGTGREKRGHADQKKLKRKTKTMDDRGETRPMSRTTSFATRRRRTGDERWNDLFTLTTTRQDHPTTNNDQTDQRTSQNDDVGKDQTKDSNGIGIVQTKSINTPLTPSPLLSLSLSLTVPVRSNARFE